MWLALLSERCRTGSKSGGEMIESVSFEKTTFEKLPFKFEAATPEEAVELVYRVPVWDASIRKFAAI